jgi:UDP-N-acetyl-D-galactosamine dehydrogenase
VLVAAKTKWNFLPFKPGLVGGHCIGVDPYYLTHKAMQLGHHPEIILAGRRINERMGAYVASRVLSLLLGSSVEVLNARVLVLGLTFKENCPDTRNSKVFEIISELSSLRCQVDVFDPYVDRLDQQLPNQCTLLDEMPDASQISMDRYQAIIVAVGHKYFSDLGTATMRELLDKDGVLFDVKSLFDKNEVDGSL